MPNTITENTFIDPFRDKFGRPWAKLSELKQGDKVELDSGFSCHPAGIVTLGMLNNKLLFECDEGIHTIAGQADDGEHLIGIYGPLP